MYLLIQNFKKEMVKYEEVLSLLNELPLKTETEHVLLENALHRVLASDVVSDMNMPPFDKAAMDGYAVRRSDLQNELKVIEIIKAGDSPQKEIGLNECSKIMTGAIVPNGADCVIMVEQVVQISKETIKFTGDKTKNNIAYKAEDIKYGETVLKRGTYLRAPEMAILASVGCVKPHVYKQPKIAVLTTGDEIVEPEIFPEKGKIRNSNATQIMAQLKTLHLNASYLGIVEDTQEALEKILIEACEKYDLLLMTGGVSMGEYDYVPDILKKIGVELLVQKVAIKPGKPTIFGKKNNTFVFGLPGNPVSSFVVFDLFVKPFIYKLCGSHYNSTTIKLPMACEYFSKEKHRLSWIPVMINEMGEVSPVSYHGSAHIYALCYANGIMPIAAGKEKISKGEWVHVRQI